MKELPNNLCNSDVSYDIDTPIAAPATPWGTSALAVIRTSGRGSLTALSLLFSKGDALLKAKSHTMVYGEINDPETGVVIDQVLIGVFRPPHGYTGEESAEIYCHGSPPGVVAILELLYKQGFKEAAPGEFTMRAFLNRKLDLTRAEAVREIIEAKSKTAHAMAFQRLSGALFERIDKVKHQLLKVAATVEVQLDYPEDEIEDELQAIVGTGTGAGVEGAEEAGVKNAEGRTVGKNAGAGNFWSNLEQAKNEIRRLLDSYAVGRIYQQGALVALAGPTNVGKSSLFNLFLKEDRSIVSEIHGTTRDYIESWISVGGVPVRLIDTAGTRDVDHPLEQEGIRRSEQITMSADLVLYLCDGSREISLEEKKIFDKHRNDKRFIFLLNKADILFSQWNDQGTDKMVAVSAKTGFGFKQLEKEIIKKLTGNYAKPKSSEGGAGEKVAIDSNRQKELLERSLSALEHIRKGAPLDGIALDLHEARQALGEITGEVSSADMLEQIFADFCVGK